MEPKCMRTVRDGQGCEDRKLCCNPDHPDADTCRDLGRNVLRPRTVLCDHGEHAEADDARHPADIVLRAVTLH